MILTSIPLSYLLARNDALKYINSHFSTQDISYIQNAYTLDIDDERLINLSKGWLYSSHLINTPSEAAPLNILLDKYVVSNYITHHSYNNKTNILKYKLHELIMKRELNHVNLDLEVLGYYYREGYSIKEIEGSGYSITEPYGSIYLIDLSFCNCINYLKSNNCIHLQLAKSYHRNLKFLRHVESSINP